MKSTVDMHNYTAICLLEHLDVVAPTEQQIEVMEQCITQLTNALKISASRFYCQLLQQRQRMWV